MGQSLSLKEGQVVDVADGHHVTLVEVGTGAVGGEIVGVNKPGVSPRRRIVDGMAVGVRHRELQCADSPAQRCLQAVVDRGSRVVQTLYVGKAWVRTEEIGIAPASDIKVYRGSPSLWQPARVEPGDRHSQARRAGSAVVIAEGIGGKIQRLMVH